MTRLADATIFELWDVKEECRHLVGRIKSARRTGLYPPIAGVIVDHRLPTRCGFFTVDEFGQPDGYCNDYERVAYCRIDCILGIAEFREQLATVESVEVDSCYLIPLEMLAGFLDAIGPIQNPWVTSWTVVQRVKQTRQPRGGYVSPKLFSQLQLDDDTKEPLALSDESISPVLVGLAVDYLTRLAIGTAPQDVFEVSLLGAANLGEPESSSAVFDVNSLSPGRVDTPTIQAACRLAGYDVAFRVSPMHFNPNANTTPDAVTVSHISVMVARGVRFFQEYGPVTLAGFNCVGGYTRIVTAGDGDYLTRDTVWDLKVSIKPPTTKHTLQLLMYYLMGKRSVHAEFDTVTHLGIFNPRLNLAYRLAVADIPTENVNEVVRSVIGYE